MDLASSAALARRQKGQDEIENMVMRPMVERGCRFGDRRSVIVIDCRSRVVGCRYLLLSFVVRSIFTDPGRVYCKKRYYYSYIGRGTLMSQIDFFTYCLFGMKIRE